MTNQFLNNVNEGKNNWWRYVLTIILTWGISSIVASIPLVIMFVVYSLSTGQFSFDYLFYIMINYESNPVLLFTAIFISFTMSLLFFILSMKYIHNRNMMSVVNSSKEEKGKKLSTLKKLSNRIRWNKILKGGLLWLAFLIVIEIINYVFSPNSFIFNFNLEKLFLMIILFIIAIPIQITFEELFFRGYLNQGLSLKFKNPVIVILISSVIFSLGHIFNGGNELIFMLQNVSITFLVGMIFSVATLVDNGIEFAIGAHLTNNFFSFIIHSSEGSLGTSTTIITTISGDPWIELIQTIIAFFIFSLILFLWKKKKVLKALQK